ncbi:MAG: WD40 repeat domain-containing protein [Candidatus Poseidoniaceae archaeon]|nr:WD40 repeat domain-containing protein [Candidatus Poseidoniaceae archaeon]
MGRNNSIAVALLMVLILLPVTAMAEEEMNSIAELKEIGSIEEMALGISQAELRPVGDQLLLVGDDGYAHLIDAANPDDRSKDVSLTSGKDVDLQATSWHPSGQTALIVGDDGMVLRLVMDNHAIETVEGRGVLEGERQKAIDWNRNGETAFLGGENGSIHSYSSANGFEQLNIADSPITAIECHPDPESRICVVTTAGDGAAVIDYNNQVHWVSNTGGDTWVDVVCPSVSLDSCVLIGSGKRIAVLHIDVDDPASSAIDNPEVLSTLEGELTGGSLMGDGRVTLHVAPYALAAYDMKEKVAWAVVTTAEVENHGSLRGSTMVHIWGTEDDKGFILSSSGALAIMTPIMEVEEEDLMGYAVVTLVVISVPGLALGMLYMNSKTIQRWWYNVTKGRKIRKQEKAKMKAEKEDDEEKTSND